MFEFIKVALLESPRTNNFLSLNDVDSGALFRAARLANDVVAKGGLHVASDGVGDVIGVRVGFGPRKTISLPSLTLAILNVLMMPLPIGAGVVVSVDVAAGGVVALVAAVVVLATGSLEVGVVAAVGVALVDAVVGGIRTKFSHIRGLKSQ